MSNRIAVAIAAAALSLAVFQQLRISRLEARIGASAGGATAETKGGDDDFAARLDELEARVQRLGRVALADPRAGGAGAALSPEDVEALKEDVSTAAVDRALTSGEGRERLRSAIREEQATLEEERRQERAQRMKQNRDERLAKFIADAKLSDSQAKSVSETYEEEWKSMQALFEDVRGGARSWQDVRGEMRDMRAATDEKVGQTLDSTQAAAWSAMRSEGWQGGPGGGGPGPGPN